MRISCLKPFFSDKSWLQALQSCTLMLADVSLFVQMSHLDLLLALTTLSKSSKPCLTQGRGPKYQELRSGRILNSPTPVSLLSALICPSVDYSLRGDFCPMCDFSEACHPSMAGLRSVLIWGSSSLYIMTEDTARLKSELGAFTKFLKQDDPLRPAYKECRSPCRILIDLMHVLDEA